MELNGNYLGSLKRSRLMILLFHGLFMVGGDNNSKMVVPFKIVDKSGWYYFMNNLTKISLGPFISQNKTIIVFTKCSQQQEIKIL